MTKERANLGFSSVLNDFNSSEWSAHPTKIKKQQKDKQLTTEAAELSGFKSREPQIHSSAIKRKQRRRRTGRNAQFNLKAKPETIEAFYAVADQKGWGLGETLEYAVLLLQKTYKK